MVNPLDPLDVARLIVLNRVIENPSKHGRPSGTCQLLLAANLAQAAHVVARVAAVGSGLIDCYCNKSNISEVLPPEIRLHLA